MRRQSAGQASPRSSVRLATPRCFGRLGREVAWPPVRSSRRRRRTARGLRVLKESCASQPHRGRGHADTCGLPISVVVRTSSHRRKSAGTAGAGGAQRGRLIRRGARPASSGPGSAVRPAPWNQPRGRRGKAWRPRPVFRAARWSRYVSWSASSGVDSQSTAGQPVRTGWRRSGAHRSRARCGCRWTAVRRFGTSRCSGRETHAAQPPRVWRERKLAGSRRSSGAVVWFRPGQRQTLIAGL